MPKTTREQKEQDMTEFKVAHDRGFAGPQLRALSTKLIRAGRIIAFAGVVLPLLLIGGMKFTAVEIEALKPLISLTPWLAWMYPVFGEAGASYLLGVIEIATALLLLASPWSAIAGVTGGGGCADLRCDLFHHARLPDLGTELGISRPRPRRPVPDQGHRPSRGGAGRHG
jgi:hypothetical protein